MMLSYRDKKEIAMMVAEELRKDMVAPDLVDKKEWMKRTGKGPGAWYNLLRTQPDLFKTRKGGREKRIDYKAFMAIYE